jgi:hypothetical protein
MKKAIKIFFIALFATVYFTSCTSINKTMREPNVRVDLTKNDFTLSDQLSAEASSIKIIGIDFARLFTQKTGNVEGGAAGINLASLPVIGNVMSDKTSNYALYELMNNNPGYDVVFYPQYETKIFKPILGIGVLTKITTVKTTARLGKLNK